MRLLNLVIHICLLCTVGCFIPFSGEGIYLPGFSVGALYSTSCVSYDSHATTTKHAAAALAMAQPPHHDESVLAAFLANPCHCHASADKAQPALSAKAWQLARVGQNGRQKTFTQAAMQGRLMPPLSLVQKITKYLINNICYFRTCFYIIIKIC
jgi:hypothetical protein